MSPRRKPLPLKSSWGNSARSNLISMCDIYVRVYEEKEIVYMDQTGKFPTILLLPAEVSNTWWWCIILMVVIFLWSPRSRERSRKWSERMLCSLVDSKTVSSTRKSKCSTTKSQKNIKKAIEKHGMTVDRECLKRHIVAMQQPRRRFKLARAISNQSLQVWQRLSFTSLGSTFAAGWINMQFVTPCQRKHPNVSAQHEYVYMGIMITIYNRICLCTRWAARFKLSMTQKHGAHGRNNQKMVFISARVPIIIEHMMCGFLKPEQLKIVIRFSSNTVISHGLRSQKQMWSQMLLTNSSRRLRETICRCAQ